MTPSKFEREIRHLDQAQILSGAISSLNKLLVDKGIAEPSELQDYFLQWMREHKLVKTEQKKK